MFFVAAPEVIFGCFWVEMFPLLKTENQYVGKHLVSKILESNKSRVNVLVLWGQTASGSQTSG